MLGTSQKARPGLSHSRMATEHVPASCTASRPGYPQAGLLKPGWPAALAAHHEVHCHAQAPHVRHPLCKSEGSRRREESECNSLVQMHRVPMAWLPRVGGGGGGRRGSTSLQAQPDRLWRHLTRHLAAEGLALRLGGVVICGMEGIQGHIHYAPVAAERCRHRIGTGRTTSYGCRRHRWLAQVALYNSQQPPVALTEGWMPPPMSTQVEWRGEWYA